MEGRVLNIRIGVQAPHTWLLFAYWGAWGSLVPLSLNVPICKAGL